MEVLANTRDAQTRVVDGQLLVLGQTLLERPQRMLDQLLPITALKLIQVALEISPGHLGAGADATSAHLLGDAGRLELEKVGALCVDAGDEQAYAVRALAVVLGVCLGAVAYPRGDFGEQDGAIVGQARGEGLLLHEVGEDASVGGETGEGDAIVAVDWYHFLLV